MADRTQTQAGGSGIPQAEVPVLPRWLEALRDHVFVGLLILLEMYLIGVGAALGWVPNLTDPHTWGLVDGVGVLLFFGGCGVFAGVSIEISHAGGKALVRGGFGGIISGIFLLLAGLCVSFITTWISASMRSNNLHPTALDLWAMRSMGWGNIPATPTLLGVVSLPPLSANLLGVLTALRRRPARKSEAERDADAADQLAAETLKQQIRALRAQGNARVLAAGAGGVRGAWNGLRGVADPEPEAPPEEAEDAGDEGEMLMLTDPDAVDGEAGASQPRLRAVPRHAPAGQLQGFWVIAQARAYVATIYGQRLSDEVASKVMSHCRSAYRITGLAGQPWSAREAEVIAALDAYAAKRKWERIAQQASA